MKTYNASWFRCRLRATRAGKYPWTYYHITIQGSQRDLMWEARYYAGLHLRRQIFDCERCYAPLEAELLKVGTINDINFYRHNALAVTPTAAGNGGAE